MLIHAPKTQTMIVIVTHLPAAIASYTSISARPLLGAVRPLFRLIAAGRLSGGSRRSMAPERGKLVEARTRCAGVACAVRLRPRVRAPKTFRRLTASETLNFTGKAAFNCRCNKADLSLMLAEQQEAHADTGKEANCSGDRARLGIKFMRASLWRRIMASWPLTILTKSDHKNCEFPREEVNEIPVSDHSIVVSSCNDFC